MTTKSLISCLALSTSMVVGAGDLSSLIYNGNVTTATEWPSMASLYFDATEYGYDDYGTFCGASIIDSQHVLTAAHCLVESEGEEVDISRLLFTSIAVQLDDKSQYLSGAVEVIRAESFYIHEDFVHGYDEGGLFNQHDIAIIKLANEMNIDESAYASLTSADQDDAYSSGDVFIAIGLGTTEYGATEQLLQTTLNYQTHSECDFDSLNDSQLCMSGELNSTTNVRNSACSGDSGSPLFVQSDNGYLQAGIASYTWEGCTATDLDTVDDTSVYIEIADYRNWIDSVLNGNVSPNYTVTDGMRDVYVYGSSKSSESGSSGGSIGFSLLGLMLIALRRFR